MGVGWPHGYHVPSSVVVECSPGHGPLVIPLILESVINLNFLRLWQIVSPVFGSLEPFS